MQNHVHLLMLFLLCGFAGGCSATGPTDQVRKKPTPLENVDSFAPEYREAARVVAASLTEHGESAKEFFAEVESKEDGQILIFHLWHESAFEPQNVGLAGNPGGKCRDIRYDVARRQVTETLFWQ